MPIFSGPGGVGKSEMALSLPRSLLGIKKDSHPDLLVLERQGSTVRIAEVRRLKEWLTLNRMRPSDGWR